MQSSNSVARTLRLQKVRETSISSTAILEKKHRKVYDLEGVRPLSKGGKRSKPGTPNPVRVDEPMNPAGSMTASNVTMLEPISANPADDQSTTSSSADTLHFSKDPLSTIVWTQRSNTPGRSSRPVSREILQPHLAKFHSNLSRKRIDELHDRISTKVATVSSKVKDKYEHLKGAMDEKNVFHPAANAQRAHSLSLTKLHKILKPDLIENTVLAEMISDDKRDLTQSEIENLENRFGNILKGTVFGAALKAPEKEKQDPEEELQQKMPLAGNAMEGRSEVSQPSLTIKELKDRKLMDFDEFKATQSRATTPGGIRSPSPDAMHDVNGFKDFQYMRTQHNRNDTRRQADKEPLMHNKSGAYSGLLKNEDGEHELIGTDVHERLWNDSERYGKKPSYKERHSDITGFKNDFLHVPEVDDGRRGGEESNYEERGGDEGVAWEDEYDEEKEEGGATSPNSSSLQRRKSRASLLKKKKRSTAEDGAGGSAIKDAQQLQVRIEQSWVKLEMPMIKKLQFLQKYSDSKYSTLLPRAVVLFEKAALAVPLREVLLKRLAQLRKSNRIGLCLLEKELDMDGCLTDIDCMLSLPESFFFEKKVEMGGLTDEELLIVEETFEQRVAGEELAYAADLKSWLSAVLDKLDDYCLQIMQEMQDEIDEKVLWRGLVYVVKKQMKVPKAEEDKQSEEEVAKVG